MSGAVMPHHVRLLPLLTAAALACSRGTATRHDSSTPGARGGGVTRQAPTARKDSGVRVLVYADMEGLAGQDDYRTFNYSHPEFYVKGQGYLIADINAVVDGLIAGGATTVDIVDAHGSGNPSPD